MTSFYGWQVLTVSFVVTAFASGAYFYGFSIFFPAIQSEFDWSRATVAGAYSLATISGGIVTLGVGLLIDRLGPRTLMLLGISIAAAGYIALGFVQSLLAYYAVFAVLIAFGLNAGFQNPAETAVAYWFVRRRAMAQGVLNSAFAIGGAVFSPLLGTLILAYGWRAAAIILGIAMVVFCLPAALVMRHRPERYGLAPDGGPTPCPARAASPAGPSEGDFTVRQALATPQFWLLTTVFALKFASSSAVFVHLIPYLVDQGFDRQTAANILGLLGLLSVSGRLLFGYLGDRFSKRVLLAVTMALEAAAVAILMTVSGLPQVILFTVIFSLGMGTLPLIPAIRAEYFGRRNFATLAGIMYGISSVGLVIGPVVAGWIFDVSKSYTGAFFLFLGIYAVAIAINLLTTPPRPATFAPRPVGVAR
ncbi:MAG: MFS transporter [Chloroflexi bacterium]|nr:MFS transporter [Chloroflexota bacterium]